jgi:hypothetical protein
MGDAADHYLSIVEQPFGGREIGGAGQGIGFHCPMMAQPVPDAPDVHHGLTELDRL